MANIPFLNNVNFEGKVGIKKPIAAYDLDIDGSLRVTGSTLLNSSIIQVGNANYSQINLVTTGTGYLENQNAAGGVGIRTGGANPRLVVDSAGAIKFNEYGAGFLVTDASGNITASTSGYGGPYLPLIGGTLTGALAGTSASFSGALDVRNAYSYFGSQKGYTYILEDQINAYYSTDADAALAINYYGYQAGGTRFRDLNVYNGKGSLVANFQGSTKATTLKGSLTGTSAEFINGVSSSWGTIFSNSIAGGHNVYTTYNNGTTSYGMLINGGSGTSSSVDFEVAGKFKVRGDGNVGIGTTSPLTILHIGTGTEANLPITLAPASGGNIEFRSTTSTGSFTFTNANGSSEKVRIDSSGNIGIGTATPSNKLQVYGTIDAYSNVNSIGIIKSDTSENSTVIKATGTYQDNWGNPTSWQADNGSYTVDSVNAPDGTGTGTSMTFAGTSFDLYKQINPGSGGGLVDGEQYKMTVWLKLGTATNFVMQPNNGAWSTLAGRSFTSEDGLNTSTWTQVTHKFTYSSGGRSYINFHIGGNTGGPTQTAGTVYTWNWQFLKVEADEFYIPNIKLDGIAGNSSYINSGNVGIGTTSPDALLDVSSASNPTIRITNTKQGSWAAGELTGGMQFYSEETSGNYPSITGSIESIAAAAGTYPLCDLSFKTTTTNAVPYERMRITYDGNVGIGTQIPSGKLTIKKSAFSTTFTSADTYLKIGGNEYLQSGYQLIGFGYSDQAASQLPAYIGFQQTATGTNTKGDLVFGTRDVTSNTAPTERMRIYSDGGITIGESTSTNAPTNGILKIRTAGNTNNTCYPLLSIMGSTHLSARQYGIGFDPEGYTDRLKMFFGVDGNGAGWSTGDFVWNINSVATTTIVSPSDEKMRLTRGGSLGIGTTNPSNGGVLGGKSLHVSSSGENVGVRVENITATIPGYAVFASGNNAHTLWGTGVKPYNFYTNSVLRFTIGASGAATFYSTVTATNFILSSDKRLKENIKELEPNKINVNWKSFNLKNAKEDYRVGVIAQELEVTNPEFVVTNDEGFKSVKYIDLLISKIAELEDRIKNLEK